MTSIWLLTDPRIGGVNQMLGIVEAMDTPYTCKEIRYTWLAKLHNIFKGASLIGISKASAQELRKPFPDFVFSAGRRTFPVARWIKKQSKGKTKIIQLMNPNGPGWNDADLIVLPEHDEYTGSAQNVMTITGTPNRVTPQKLNKERNQWADTFECFPAPRVSVIVGGATKNNPFTPAMAAELVSGIKALDPASVLITTSRRTPADVINVLKQELPSPTYFYEWGNSAPNPYFGLLSWADKIVVTGDSMSMCTECCGVGKPVYIFAPDDMMGDKHKRFHQALYQGGFAAPLGTGQTPAGKILSPAQNVADEIKKLFKKTLTSH